MKVAHIKIPHIKIPHMKIRHMKIRHWLSLSALIAFATSAIASPEAQQRRGGLQGARTGAMPVLCEFKAADVVVRARTPEECRKIGGAVLPSPKRTLGPARPAAAKPVSGG